MLKEFIFCFLILIIILFGNNQTQNYTKESVKNISEQLTQLRQNLINKYDKIDEEKAKKEMENIEKEWENRHDKLAYFIEHDELEKVETNITALKSYIETKKYEESISELDKAEFLLKHIQDKYAFNLENIF